MDFFNVKTVTLNVPNAAVIKPSGIPCTVADPEKYSCTCLDISNPDVYDSLCKIAEAIAPCSSCES